MVYSLLCLTSCNGSWHSLPDGWQISSEPKICSELSQWEKSIQLLDIWWAFRTQKIYIQNIWIWSTFNDAVTFRFRPLLWLSPGTWAAMPRLLSSCSPSQSVLTAWQFRAVNQTCWILHPNMPVSFLAMVVISEQPETEISAVPKPIPKFWSKVSATILLVLL